MRGRCMDIRPDLKNVAEALWVTIMNITHNPKDNIKASVDPTILCDRPKEKKPLIHEHTWRRAKS